MLRSSGESLPQDGYSCCDSETGRVNVGAAKVIQTTLLTKVMHA